MFPSRVDTSSKVFLPEPRADRAGPTPGCHQPANHSGPRRHRLPQRPWSPAPRRRLLSASSVARTNHGSTARTARKWNVHTIHDTAEPRSRHVGAGIRLWPGPSASAAWSDCHPTRRQQALPRLWVVAHSVRDAAFQPVGRHLTPADSGPGPADEVPGERLEPGEGARWVTRRGDAGGGQIGSGHRQSPRGHCPEHCSGLAPMIGRDIQRLGPLRLAQSQFKA